MYCKSFAKTPPGEMQTNQHEECLKAQENCLSFDFSSKYYIEALFFSA